MKYDTARVTSQAMQGVPLSNYTMQQIWYKDGVLVYLFALVFISGANRGERLYGDACAAG